MNLRRCIRAASALALLLGPSPIRAHTISPDGSAAEWFGVPSTAVDLGRIARRGDGGGEYVWRDAIGDARSTWPSRPHDLTELRVTGDAEALYVLAKLTGPVAVSGDSAPQLQITIDTDRLPFSGGTFFADSAGLEIAGSAAYEALLETRFGSGQPPRLLDALGNEYAGGATAAIASSGVIEIALPWSALGYTFVPSSPLRLGAALFLTRADDVPIDPQDAAPGRAADAMTQYGAPGNAGTTGIEVTDGVLDYAFDLWFNARGEVVAPLVVNEAFFGADSESRWLEVVNPTQAVVSLSSFKLGDQVTPDGGEAIAQFPLGAQLVPGQTFVVARNGAAFLSASGTRANAECASADAGTPDMFMSPAWTLQPGVTLPDCGDELLVLDGANTVVDVVTVRGAAWPGVVAHPGVASTHSIERVNPGVDSDDCSIDFADQPAPTPGWALVVAGLGSAHPRGGLAWGPPAPNPASGRVTLSLRLAAGDDVRVDVLDPAGRRIRELYRGSAASGALVLDWDGRDEAGRDVSPGLYFVRAATREGSRSLRVTVMR